MVLLEIIEELTKIKISILYGLIDYNGKKIVFLHNVTCNDIIMAVWNSTSSLFRN